MAAAGTEDDSFGDLCPRCKSAVTRSGGIYQYLRYWHPKCFTCSKCGKPFAAGERAYKAAGEDGVVYHEECMNAVRADEKVQGSASTDDEPKVYFTSFLRAEMTPGHLAECLALSCDRWFLEKAKEKEAAPSEKVTQAKKDKTEKKKVAVSSKKMQEEEDEGIDVAAELAARASQLKG
uniref:LIM zinc-binding domain-containing protein n=1 Tax=Eutreptiella gymnastica TaxID=73025 RepID=A0A7S4G1F9_9EUGL